ncbi:uncharacterized protein KQ657_000922 [Scheffersomyces spartinae]|uniref:Uncharacterized protein n=1 Tax=Scheffersomyces spartinae TaxID=45513 RepID=A0A9P8AHU8_9ASCO|nr:uncharacterized protein KQ657_000922 [Scheffersomyces spartinae]KAG7193168.1 hypothetical protein KQ657_000922 [Scheffersomyces spartinae]
MACLIVDPKQLTWKFPEASTALPCRVRLVVQVVNYVDEKEYIQVCPIPGIGNNRNNNEAFSIDVHNVLGQLKPESVYGGAIIGIGAFWDGIELNVFECQPINGQGLDASLLTSMSELEPI